MALGMLSKTVTNHGTPVQLTATAKSVNWVMIQAKRTNTGRIYVGDSTIKNDDSTGYCLVIPAVAAVPSVTLPQLGSGTPNTFELNQIWIDSTVDAEGVNVIYDQV